MSSIAVFTLIPLISLTSRARFSLPMKSTTTRPSSLAKISCSQNSSPQNQLNLSVLRFTLGIPGLDESYLPRYIGYAFGAVIVLNHFVGSDSSTTAAQLRTEAIGLSLAAFSAVVPYLGKFLKGAATTEQKSIPESAKQIFIMSEGIADNIKEDLAWGSYVLFRNTNSISVLISVEDALCVRGYWNTPMDESKKDICRWFRSQIHKVGLSDLKDTMYFEQAPDSELKEMVPKGIKSLLVLPIRAAPKGGSMESQKIKGFVLLASSMDYPYTDKDKAWIAAIANKFRGSSSLS